MLTAAIALICSVAFSGVHGRIAIGACPSVTAKSDVDFSAFAGAWFEVSRYRSINQAQTDCTSYFLNLQSGDTILMFDVTSQDTMDNTALQVVFNFAISGTSGVLTRTDGSDVTILDTDNTNYAVLYSCEAIATLSGSRTLRREFLWVLSRADSGLDMSSSSTVSTVISDNGLSEDLLVATDQSDCE